MTLGLAVRISQSIGLHVETTSPILLEGQASLIAETRRRVWYSIYVLDRLVSLQLGRPPAVHDDTSYVRLPSRLDDADIDWEGDSPQLLEPNDPTTGDYFLSVISLSKIIGYVLRDLYAPQGERISMGGLRSTGLLDKQLLEWKCGLPRPLRFDFGHAFETSTVFKKQVSLAPSPIYPHRQWNGKLKKLRLADQVHRWAAEHVGNKVPSPPGLDTQTVPLYSAIARSQRRPGYHVTKRTLSSRAI